jgi:predicted outer membrane protein
VRESELTSKRMALVQQRRPLSDDFDRARNLIRSHQSSVDALNRKISDRSNDPVAKSSYRKDLALAQQSLEHTVNVEQQLERAVTEINDQLGPIDQELASIRLKKLEV